MRTCITIAVAAYQAKGETERAIADFEQTSRIEPTSSRGLSGHGAALFVKGEIDRAIAEFDEAIRLDSRNIFAAIYSTVTLFARLRGWSTSLPMKTAV
jgi:tetratricopeptide (TPR) repeat protein